VEHAETFDYAIRKDVRNTTIVREVDERKHRELWTSLAIGAVLVVVVMFDAWQHFELIRQGYAIEALQKARAEEDEASRHLRLEAATLRAPPPGSACRCRRRPTRSSSSACCRPSRRTAR
jgi:hypothetical protein